ncbi:hypothetical protein CR513_14859, partial [Mucuna pruriens]
MVGKWANLLDVPSEDRTTQLVILKNQQVEDLDYLETFVLVAKMTIMSKDY